MKLTDEQLKKLYEYLNGTTNSVQSGLESIEVNADDYDVNDIEEQLADENLEICPGCGWWVESDELVGVDDDEYDGDQVMCEDCRN